MPINPEVVDANDVRVVSKARRGPCFLPKAAGEIEGADDAVANELNGYGSLEEIVDGRVHCTHSAATEPALQTVTAIQDAGPLRDRQSKIVLGTHHGLRVKTSSATVAFTEVMALCSRPLEYDPDAMRDSKK